MSVRVNFEIGHQAAIRSKRTNEGYTHDWEVFVRGCDNANIHFFVEKVVFHLHQTFTNPKRIIKDPPYRVCESGYAGFLVPIDIYFRTNEEPKKIKFYYDLILQEKGPAIEEIKKEKYIFNNPSEEFRQKLLKGGAALLNPLSDAKRDPSDKLAKSKSSSSSDLSKKHKIKERKQEDSFTNLFGTPIKTSKSAEVKIPSKDSPVNVEVKDKSSSSKKSKSTHSPKEKDKERDKEKKDKSLERKHKDEKKKEKERSKEKERKDKSIKRERSPKQLSASPKRSPKRSSSPKRAPSPKPPVSPLLVKPKEEKKPEEVKDKSKIDVKNKKEQKEKKEHKSHKDKELNRSIEQREHKSSKEIKLKEQLIPKIKEKPIRPDEPPIKEPEKVEEIKPDRVEIEKQPEKSKHKHKKKDSKEKKEKKEERIKEKKIEKIEKANLFSKPYKEEFKESPKEIEKPIPTKLPEPVENNSREKSLKSISSLKPDLIDNSSDSSIMSHDESSVDVPTLTKPIDKNEVKKVKEKNKESSEKKKKRKHDAALVKEDLVVKPEEPPVKVMREEPDCNKTQSETKKDIVEDDTENYMGILKELRHKIMTLKNNDELQHVVQMIAETGKFELTTNTFDFDLCALDRETVRKLQNFFAIL